MGDFWLRPISGVVLVFIAAGHFCVRSVVAQAPTPPSSSAPPRAALADATPADVLTPEEWNRVDGAVERGLKWLASQQDNEGAFPTIPLGQPGVTSLCMMAFVAHGH